MLVVLGGNIAQKYVHCAPIVETTLTVPSPQTIALFIAYFVVILAGLVILNSRLRIARAVLWMFDQTQILRGWQLDRIVIRWIKQFRSAPVVVWVKEDHVGCVSRIVLSC